MPAKRSRSIGKYHVDNVDPAGTICPPERRPHVALDRGQEGDIGVAFRRWPSQRPSPLLGRRSGCTKPLRWPPDSVCWAVGAGAGRRHRVGGIVTGNAVLDAWCGSRRRHRVLATGEPRTTPDRSRLAVASQEGLLIEADVGLPLRGHAGTASATTSTRQPGERPHALGATAVTSGRSGIRLLRPATCPWP